MYFYIQSNNNYDFQLKAYSVLRGSSLVDAFLIYVQKFIPRHRFISNIAMH